MVFDVNSLEKVTEESRRDRSWSFDADNKIYFSYDNKTKEIKSYIKGINLPDPLKIKKELKQRALNQKDSINMRTDADPVTYVLYSHWKEFNSNVNAHN